MNNEKMESMIKKIQGLLALASDNTNEAEAQSAFVMAQKLMIKYNIELSEIEGTEDVSNVTQGQATAYKTVNWQEKMLASIIAENFRVKHYYNSRYVYGSGRRKKCIMFFGLEQDVKIAKEIFVLASDILENYAKKFVKHRYSVMVGVGRSRELHKRLKDSYMLGFLQGLNEKLKTQRFALQEEFGLVVLMPQVVHDEYDKFSSNFTKSTATRIPDANESRAYQQGFKDGEKVDYTKSTLDK